MATLKWNYVFIVNFQKKFLHIINLLWLFELKLANATFMFPNILTWKKKLEDRKERVPGF